MFALIYRLAYVAAMTWPVGHTVTVPVLIPAGVCGQRVGPKLTTKRSPQADCIPAFDTAASRGHAAYACSNGGLRFFGSVIIDHLVRVMAPLDFIVIGFGSFVAMTAIGIVALLAAHRH